MTSEKPYFFFETKFARTEHGVPQRFFETQFVCKPLNGSDFVVWPVVANPGCIGKSLNLKDNSGEGGIRTHGGVTPTPVFETGLFNRSSTSPNEADKGTILRDQKRFAAALVVYRLEVLWSYWRAGIELLD